MVTITNDEIVCEHPKRPRESIRWDAVTEIRLVTTSRDLYDPGDWFAFIGAEGGCSVPFEAQGFDQLWTVFKTRYPEIDYGAILNTGTPYSQRTIWTKGANQRLVPREAHGTT